MTMVLVNEAQGYRVCMECHEMLTARDDEYVWMQRHLGADGCEACVPSAVP